MTDAFDRLKAALADRYAIERELGAGGMATVYLAHDQKHDRKVAVKVFRPELAAALGTERFFREIKITANLSHPHILPLLDSGTAERRYGGTAVASWSEGRSGGRAEGEAGEFLYYVMPYVEGESLRERLNCDKQLSVDDALKITNQVASALSYAHSHDIVHRDIKPENILFQAGEVVVADFGIALAVDSAGVTRLTEAGFSLGTPAYMSPEQVSGEQEIDGRSDVYSLACVLYEMLAGDPPFVASNPRAVMAKHMTDPAPPITTVRSSVSQPVAAALAKALSKAPADRFETAQSFGDSLVAAEAKVEGEKKSIVVLPFDDLSPNRDNEYFSDGLTDEIIADLSRLKSLHVISRNSAMQLKGTDKDTKTIGRELNVQYVLEGAVRRAGDRLRITAQLIDAARDAHLWTEKYDGLLEDVFDMQETISRKIVDALEVRLSPEEARRVGLRPISNVHALESYLKARQEVWRATEESLDRALKLLDDGLRVVGDNELLYAGKGSALWQYVNHMLKPAATYESHIKEADEYADRALVLNRDSSVAHVLKGQVCNNRSEPKESLHHFLRAVAIDANNPEALFWVGYVLAASERGAMSRPYFERAIAVDPLTPMTQAMPAWLDFFEGRFGVTADMFCRLFEIDPQNVAGKSWGAWCVALSGRIDQALALTDGLASDPSRPITGIALFFRYALERRSEDALRAATADFLEAARWDDLTSLQMAEGFALIGENERALEWLERTIRFGVASVPFFSKHDPFLENIRDEPRFAELMDLAKDVASDVGSEMESFTPPW